MNIVLNAALWAIFGSLVSIGLTFVLMRVLLGVGFSETIREIEEDHNVAVSIFYMLFAVVINIYVGAFATAGFTQSASTAEGALWIVGGFFLALIASGLTISAFVMGMATRQPGESVLAYLRRELIVEDNGALAWFVAGLSISWFLQVWFQVI